MATTEYLPFANEAGSNVDAQTDFAGSQWQRQGFTTGTAHSSQVNKVWRQAAMMSSAWANVIMQLTSQSVLDDGNQANLIAQILLALGNLISSRVRPKILTVPFSASPTFDCNSAALINPVFSITLAGNVVSSQLINAIPGQFLIFGINQDATGNRTWTWPTNFHGGGFVDGTPGQLNTQCFLVGTSNDIDALTPMISRI